MRPSARAESLLAFALACALAACAPPVARDQIRARLASEPHPNLVLCVVDTLRADRITPYGSAADTTPELARWAAQGVVFERALAQSSWTKILASLLTSLWPRSHALREVRDGLGDAAHTLAERLGDAGYQRYAVQTNGWLDQSFGFQQGFERYVFPTGRGSSWGKPSVWPHVDRVLDETARLLAARDRRPFFCTSTSWTPRYSAPPESALGRTRTVPISPRSPGGLRASPRARGARAGRCAEHLDRSRATTASLGEHGARPSPRPSRTLLTCRC